ncbi:hypothetical protein I302_106826 [Kwoniella bestiolae CBS 10118]|uniref:Uncharacterized protein n=1 Tax=Kwoniella bestiolae CBS 10118 TaxID=1296100 RepID=A0A1B9G0B0_9TREE|nr:hypothetical protein I302_05909 [Kwoniella bestiolae CBS 10118]OCF24449.1 hypothetical protein I302_05909 [Kwoniella bestiolae CBS 10118]
MTEGPPYPVGLPDSPDFPGVDFVVQTSHPPSTLATRVQSNAIVSYREQTSTLPFLFNVINGPGCYFTSFRSQSGAKVAISRQELSRAWVIGLNAMRFYGRLLYHLTQEWEQPIMHKYSPTALRIKRAAQEWTGCFKEIDWAMGILKQCENTHSIPSTWITPASYDITDLTLTSPSPIKNQELQPLNDVFIYAALHLLKLDRQGYNAECLALAESVDFKLDQMQHCYIPDIGLNLPPDLKDSENG